MRIAEVAFPIPLHRRFDYSIPSGMNIVPGVRVRAPFGPRSLVGTVLSVTDKEPMRALKPLGQAIDLIPLLSEDLLETADWISRRYCAPIGECLKSVGPPFLKEAKKPRPSSSAPPAEFKSGGPAFVLTPGQEKAVGVLTERLEARRFGAALLFGVPASGKTEVYLRLIRKVAASGGQCLFLLPEISLTAPFFAEFSAQLGHPVVLWHSQLAGSQRRSAWLGLKDGSVKAVVGARSASLLPFADLRLIVIDEEQDESFKQEGASPLYHARELAMHRAHRARALVVLGSATPSLETWEAVRRGTIELFAMPDRIAGERPRVDILPLPRFGNCLSDELVSAVEDRRRRGEQSILLVNRRGFSTVVMCFQCGWVDRCPTCAVAFISHQDPGGGFILRCHHCGKSKAQPSACLKCSKLSLRATGTGTQRVVSELKTRLSGVKVLRMDRDSLTKGEAQDRRIYERFLNREAEVLVGTKLVAKSFHFPDVTLVGVVDADTMIHMPDFRSSERTMQLLAQVAGRSGRAQKPGVVLIQTLFPDHYAIASAAHGDYGQFADKELEFRKELVYPPYSTLVRLIWSGLKEETVSPAASEMTELLREELGSGHDLLGPAAAVPAVVRGRYRAHSLMKVLSPELLEPACAKALSLPLPSTVKLKINVDPYDLF